MDKKALFIAGGLTAALLGFSFATGKLGGTKDDPVVIPKRRLPMSTEAHQTGASDTSNADAASSVLASMNAPASPATPDSSAQASSSTVLPPLPMAPGEPATAANMGPGLNVPPASPSATNTRGSAAGMPPGAPGGLIPPPLPASAASSPVALPPPPMPQPPSRELSAGNSSVPATAGASPASVIPTSGALPTGSELIDLQSRLVMLDKQKTIAAEEEAIANSVLNRRKAEYEASQIGHAKPAEGASPSEVNRTGPAKASPSSPLDNMQLVATSKTTADAVATVRFNGRLIDLTRGSKIAGAFVEKVTDQSVTLTYAGIAHTLYMN